MFSDFSKFYQPRGYGVSCLLCCPQWEKYSHGTSGLLASKGTARHSSGQHSSNQECIQSTKGHKIMLSCALKSKENFRVLLPQCHISPSVLQKVNQRSAEAKWHAHSHKAIWQLSSDQKPIISSHATHSRHGGTVCGTEFQYRSSYISLFSTGFSLCICMFYTIKHIIAHLLYFPIRQI